MKFSRVLFIITLLVILLLGIFDLPRFHINVGGNDLQWPAIDFSIFQPGSPWGNLRKGSGLYPSDQIHFQAQFETDQTNKADVFADDVALIRRRMEAANLYDVDLTTQVSGDNYQLVFTFPAYYQEVNMQRVALLLVQPGNVDIIENNPTPAEGETPDSVMAQFYPGYIPVESRVRVSDIASVSIETRSAIDGSLWRVKFKDSAKAALAAAVADAGYTTSNSPMPMIITIDNGPVMVLVSIGQDLDMLARPFDSTTDVTELKVMSSYLLGSVGVRTTYNLSNADQQSPIYAADGKTLPALLVVASAIILALFAWRRYGRTGLIAFSLGLAGYILMLVAVFKLLAVSLSIGFVMGFIVAYALGALVMMDLLRGDASLAKQTLKKYKQVAGMLLFTAGVAYVANIGFGAYQDILGVIAMAGLVLFISCYFFFAQVMAFIYSRKN